MRMWLVDPKIMCRQHLLGEHVEMHMFAGTIERKMSIAGYLENNLLEPKLIRTRHDRLAKEMERRGFNHNSPLTPPDTAYLTETQIEWQIDRTQARNELLSRCNQCGNTERRKPS